MTDRCEILVASDFTARSAHPLGRARQLAIAHGGRLAIVHIVADADADAIAARLRADLPADAELIVGRGAVAKTVVEIAAGRQSALIVTGVARYKNVGDYILGTSVDHIVRNAPAPVLVARSEPRGAYGRLLLATDFSACSRAALLTAARLVPDVPIHVVHVFDVPFSGWLRSEDVRSDMQADAQAGLHDFLAHPDIAPDLRSRIDARVVQGEIAAVVMDQLADADLLVLGTHGRSGFSHAAIGSQAEKLLAAVNGDVLLVREARG